MKFLFLGDSITDCDRSFDPEGLGEGYVRILAKELGKDHLFLNKGTDGFTVSNVKRVWEMYYSDIDPDFITLLVGINDVAVMQMDSMSAEASLQKFAKTYEELILSIRSKASCPLLLMEPFIFPQPAAFLNWYPLVQQLSTIIQNLADKHHLAFLPLWQSFLAAGEREGFQNITLDGVHLTHQGHRILADAWLQNFKKNEDNYEL